jgi:HK97 family phage prohead protease
MSNELFKDLTFKVYSSTFEKSEKDGKRIICGYASTSDLDLEREIVSRKALEKAKDDLLKSPTVFLDHNHSALTACGRVIDCILDDKGLFITVLLSNASYVNDIWILCQEGVLNSFSIGGIVVDGHDERGEDGKSYHVIDEILILECSIVGIPCNQNARFSVYKSFNSAIAEQIKQKEESQKMAKLDKQEVLKSEAPQEPLKVEEPKEQVALEVASPVSTETKEVIAKDVAPEVKKEETVETPKPVEVPLLAKEVEIKKEEVIEAPKASEEAPKETVEKAKVDETPSEGNPNPGLVVEDAEKAEWTTEYINTLPNSSFAVIEPAYLEGKTEDKNCRHLPFKNENGEVDLPHYRNALARCNQIKPVTDSISEADLRSQAAAELEKYRDLLGKESEKSTDEKILDALALIIEKLSALDKKEVTEIKEEVIEAPKPEVKEEKAQEVVSEKKEEEITVEKKEETKVEEKIEKTVEKKEEEPTRKSLAIVVPSPYEEENEKETNPKEVEKNKNMGWSKLIFGK